MITGWRAGDGPAIVDAWNRSLPEDPISPARFRDLILLDPNFDPDGLRVARSPAGEVLGAAYAVRRKTAMTGTDLEPERGWLVFFFVDPPARGRGIGRRLVEDALTWLRERGGREALFSPYTPNYVLPGLDRRAYPVAGRLLDDLKFTTRYQAVAMDRSLVGYAVPEEVAERARALTASGWRLGTPGTDDLPELVALAGDHFNPDWARAIREALIGGLPLERIVIARDASGHLVGWAMHGAYDSVVDRFGPFGVREDQRGTGLGKVLLHLTLRRMRACSAHGAWFLWTGERSPAGHLYLAAGFSVTRRFDVMNRVL